MFQIIALLEMAAIYIGYFSKMIRQRQRGIQTDQMGKGKEGFDLMYIGILLMFFNRVLFAVSVFAMLMFHLQIVNVEEDHLLAAFGDEYLAYKKRVCRYIGRRL